MNMGCNLQLRLDEIIAEHKLSVYFQPIIDFRKRLIYGYEALIRGPCNSPLHSPVELFDAATRHDRLFELEVACLQTAVERFLQLNIEANLFLNVSAACLLAADKERTVWEALASFTGIKKQQVVLELTEKDIIKDFSMVRDIIGRCRERGYHVAMDDLGSGHSGLRAWLELRPDFIKIDLHFIAGIHEDAVKRQFVHSIQGLAADMDCSVIAEGIETLDELEVVRTIGIPFGQGFYFGQPGINPPRDIEPQWLNGSYYDNARSRVVRFKETVDSILKKTPHVSPDTTINHVAEIFLNQRLLLSIPVVEGNRTLGIVDRNQFLQLYASRFGPELYGRQMIATIMSTPVIVEKDTPVESVSHLLTNGEAWRTGTDFIICDRQAYLGTASVFDLLRRITELQIRAARYANPLTLLPGNVPITETISGILAANRPFTVCYCDIDSFKPFNDKYSYARGDDIIRMLATVIAEHVDPQLDFVGHIGGDDFIIVFLGDDWSDRCAWIMHSFSGLLERFYDPDDFAQGGIPSIDRRGNAVFFPLMSLSIGAVPISQNCVPLSAHDVATLATEAKSQAKRIEGNALFTDRRQHRPATDSAARMETGRMESEVVRAA
jgi:EAL domain-containing protein (putative c-di-GMP-specific phosphodiesterase class I)/GGDEF domain-containing protein/CBS domain-containing protein